MSLTRCVLEANLLVLAVSGILLSSLFLLSTRKSLNHVVDIVQAFKALGIKEVV